MSEENKDWNALFKERYAAQQRDKAQRLKEAKAAAAGTSKEPFNARKFKKLYIKLNGYGLDEHTPWETIIKESEYNYYVLHKDIVTLEALVKHIAWMEGYG
jgi:hypothetical protein